MNFEILFDNLFFRLENIEKYFTTKQCLESYKKMLCYDCNGDVVYIFQ